MNTDAKGYYAVLGIDPEASDEAIRGAFRRRAKEVHPDSTSGNATSFILLKRAYDTLIDPEHRAAYDAACRPPSPPPPRPRPAPAGHRRPPTFQPPPLPPRSAAFRRSGVGFVRYAVAFLVMAAISIGGVQAMISWTAAPPSIQARGPVDRAESRPAAAHTPAAQSSTAPGSSTSGFWDATPPATGGRAP